MQYRTIGQTGLRVSEIGFGCGNNAALMVKSSHEDQVKAVRHALDQGINFFDTAFAYGWGKSEENLGQILNELCANPVISTKIWVWKPRLGRTLKSRTIRAIEAGLARLKRERVDFVQLHTKVTSKRRSGDRYSLTPKDVLGSYGVLAGLKRMRDRNKVGFFGSVVSAIRKRCMNWSKAVNFMAFSVTTICSTPAPGMPSQKTSAPSITVKSSIALQPSEWARL